MLHQPRGRRAARPTVLTCVDWNPPGRVAWRWEADEELVDFAYALEPVWTSTRLTWSQELSASRVLGAARGRAMVRQLRALRQRLER